MKNGIFGVAIILTVGACATTEPSATTVVDPLVGKELVVNEENKLVLNADGSMSGIMRGEVAAGSYSANSTEVCSSFSAPEFLIGREYCSVPEIDGDTVIFNRRDGSQSPVYTIAG